MKRHGNLWAGLTSFENLYLAFTKAIKGKRLKPGVARFIVHAEDELVALRRELLDQTYRPGPYRTFLIYDGKTRLISAAPFRDRMVHHAFCNVVEPIFERHFIHDLYANRKGKGVHLAVRRAQEFARKYPYVLKCDIRKYFPSIDHQWLKEQLAGKIKCRETLRLAGLIIDSGGRQEGVAESFPGAAERPRGLPIGNQTSQFLSNVCLSRMDHWVKEELGAGGYVRYVDDFLLFGAAKRLLWAWKARLDEYLASCRLAYKPNGVNLFPVRRGFPFLGYRVSPVSILVCRDSILRFRRQARKVRARWRSGVIGLGRVRGFVFGSLGHFAQADSQSLRRKLLADTWF